MEQYLIPANSKKSQLIFGVFQPIDLVIMVIGIFLSLILMLLIPGETVIMLCIKMIPTVICDVCLLALSFFVKKESCERKRRHGGLQKAAPLASPQENLQRSMRNKYGSSLCGNLLKRNTKASI